MSEERLKPCPFCGGTTEITYDEHGYYGVSCIHCDYTSERYAQSIYAIAAHNRVCRAVESATKQAATDCNHLGNAAKMREALKTISKCDISKEEDCISIYRVCEAALAVSPRNCDVLSKDEVLKVLDDRSFSKEDTIEWLYAEAKGETDGCK